MRMHLVSRSLAAAALMLALAACTITFEPATDPPPRVTTRPAFVVLEQFVPDRGVNSTYRIGDPIGFRVRTTQDGYVTLTAIDPGGAVYVFARNVPVRAGRTNVIDGLGPRQRFVITAPEGLHRVVAHFTPRATDEVVTFRGIAGYDSWQSQIRIELQPYPTGEYRETRFFVRR
jgi:hypothetical protein